MKLIDLYKQWMETGEMEECRYPNGFGGLCNAVPKQYEKDVNLFSPENDKIYWAAENSDVTNNTFNQTRQLITLFICAMHDEL